MHDKGKQGNKGEERDIRVYVFRREQKRGNHQVIKSKSGVVEW